VYISEESRVPPFDIVYGFFVGSASFEASRVVSFVERDMR